jgi:hypothetical protein
MCLAESALLGGRAGMLASLSAMVSAREPALRGATQIVTSADATVYAGAAA